MVTLLKMLLAGWALSLLMGCCTWWDARPDDEGLSYYHEEPEWKTTTTTTETHGTATHTTTETHGTATHGSTHETVYTEYEYSHGGIPYPERASAAWW